MPQTVWTVLSLVSVAVLATPVTSVCPYNVTACTCTGSSLVCKDLHSLPPLVSDNQDGNITDLTIESGKLDSITADSLPWNLQSITLSNMEIQSISPGALNNSLVTLKSVSMKGVIFPGSPDALLKVQNLTELNLTNTVITNWTTEVFQHLGKTLRSIVLSNVDLKIWPDWLNNFTLLNRVEVSSNDEFSNISSSAFSKMEKLTYLSLRSNAIWGQNVLNVLAPLSNTLEYLDIGDNILKEVPKIITSLTKLSTLIADSNQITEITADRFPAQLTSLNLMGNQILVLTNNSFPKSPSLKVLILSGFKMRTIYNISVLAFEPVPNLTELYLDGNSLYRVPLAITKLNHLEILKLDLNTQLKCSCPRDENIVNWFQSQKKLKLTGRCSQETYTIEDYLSSTNEALFCAGHHITGNVFLYLLVVVLLTFRSL